MKIIRICILAWVTQLCLLGTALAEFREWTDKDGNTVKAEFVRKEVESVIFRKEDGTEFKVSYHSLSDADRKLVMLQTPPRIEIKVEPSVDSYTVGYLGNDGYDYTIQYEVVEPSVLLRKVSTEPYDAPLKMELVIIGRIREIDRYIIVDRNSAEFSFTGKQSYEYTYEGYPLDLRQIKGSWKSGIQYEGYLLAIRDSRGVLIAIKGTKNALEKNAEEVVKAEVGSMLTDSMKVVTPHRVPPATGFEQPALTF